MKTLNQYVHELTRDHVTGLNENKKTLVEQSLLATLREKAYEKGSGGGGSSTGGSKSPIALQPLDLLNEIETVVYQNAPKLKTLEESIQRWAETTRETDYLYQWLEYWYNAIRELDIRRFDLIGSCPECGASEIVVYDEDGGGGILKKPALTRVEGACRADCGLCLAVWEGQKEIEELARRL